MTCHQVVNAYQEDRVQDDDLTQKHYLLFGTHGTDQMPRSAVFLAGCISTVLCIFFVFVYGGGGGGEVLCCRCGCHRCIVATADGRLVFIVDEGLGIDPAVEFGGVVVPFHQRLRSSPYLTPLQHRFHAVHFIDGYRHLLQLRLVEGAVQHFTEIFVQSVHRQIGGVKLVYGEYLFTPIRRVAFFELTLVLTDAHAIRLWPAFGERGCQRHYQ